MPQAIDYDALAQQHGGTVTAAPASGSDLDYDALAAQHGGSVVPPDFKAETTASESDPSLWQQLTSGGPAQPPSMADTALGAAIPFLPPQVSVGVAQRVGKTALGATQLLTRGARYIPGVNRVLPSDATFETGRAALDPRNMQQRVGQGLEQTAEFFLPAGALGKLKTAAKTGVGLLDALVSAGAEGASAAGVSSVQRGAVDADAAKTGLLAAGATAAFEGAAPKVGEGLTWLGERVERALVKPTKADVQDGFKIGNIFKYKLGGSLSQTYDKVTSAIAEQANRLASVENISNQLGRKVDPVQALNAVEADLGRNAARNTGQNVAIQNAIGKLREDLAGQGITGPVNWATGNDIKQAIGDLGAWMHDPSGKIYGADERAMETVANALYGKLKGNLTQQAFGPITLINNAFSELIPIRQAIIRRIPVEARQNVINLGDLLGVSSGHLGLSLANRFLRSGQFANLAVRGGEGLTQAAPQLAPVVGRLTGAGAPIP